MKSAFTKTFAGVVLFALILAVGSSGALAAAPGRPAAALGRTAAAPGRPAAALGRTAAAPAQSSTTETQEVGDLAPARAWEGTFVLPAYAEGPPNPNPPFDLFRLGRLNYPYTIRDNVTDRREARNWRALFLENEYLRCVVLPDFGGHLYSCTDKVNNAELFYANPSIKLALLTLSVQL